MVDKVTYEFLDDLGAPAVYWRLAWRGDRFHPRSGACFWSESAFRANHARLYRSGPQGRGTNLRRFLQHKAARVVAVCDVFADRRSKAKKMVDAHNGNRDCQAYGDFRELLADDAIDAVVISTPDHWHVPMSLMALLANKDVFCEKPTLTIDEGRVLSEAVRRHEAVFQWGIEDRSLREYYNLAAWVRNGEIGELKRVEVGLPPGKAYPEEEPARVPGGLDYDK